MVLTLLLADISAVITTPFSFIDEALDVPKAEAASQPPAIKVESFDQDVGADGTTFTLNNDVGATSSAFIRMLTGTRKTSAGRTESTSNLAPNTGTVGLELTDTSTVTVHRIDPLEVKVMGEVWRYEGAAGSGNEFIVRDRVAVSLTGPSISTAIPDITDVDKVVPFVTGYTVNDASASNWEAATIAAHMDDSGNLIVSRNNSGSAATVYVDVVEFTGDEWRVCHGYSNSHDTAEQTITLNTSTDGQGGSTCDVGDWGTATIIEATMEGDSSETGLSDTLALVRPGGTTDTVVFDPQQDAAARNDGEAWIHVLQNDNLVVNRASNADIAEGDGTYGTATWPSGATTTASIDTLSLEWFTDTSGVGTAHMRGGLHARITDGAINYGDGDPVDSSEYDSTLEANFTGDVTFSATPSGVIYEAGGTGTGSFVGYNDAGDFIIRAGNGGSTAPTDAARIVITTSEYDFSSRTGTLEWNFYPDTESVDLSFDESSNGSIDYSTSTTAAAAWANWSGGDDGFVGDSNGNIAGSEITSGYNFDGTIDTIAFTQGGSPYEVQHWIHRSGNTVGVEYGVVELTNLSAITEDTIVTATGTQAVEVDIPTTNHYVGGTFAIEENNASRNVTNITISESGTVDGANGLADIELWYDLATSSPYTCINESYDGDEIQFGSTDSNGFSGADGVSSFTDTESITPTRSMCVYVVLDVTASSTDGETIEIAIDNPTTDVITTGGGSVSPATTQALDGSTTLRNAELTQTHYHWLEDDGVEGAASSVEGAEDTPASGFSNGTVRRLRLQVSAEGSTSSEPVQLRLEYGAKVTTCSAVNSWTDVGAVGGDWDMSDSTFITDGNDSTDLAPGSGGTTNENTTHLISNGALRDTSSQLNSLTFSSANFLEAEFAIEPTVSAPQGTSYCFRVTDAGTDLRNYDLYPEATISADVLVSAIGSQTTTLDAASSDQYVGGAFVFARDQVASRNVTDITVTETGSINAANDLNNIELYYETAADCSLESFNGTTTETQFGATDTTGFSAANGTSTFSDSVGISSGTELCVYVVFDVVGVVGNGETIDIQITNPATEVVASGGSTIAPNTVVALSGLTTVSSAVLTQVHYHWRNDDGSETGATSATGGSEDTPIDLVPQESPRRLRLGISNEGTVDSAATTYRLEYATKVSTCNAATGWTDVDTPGDAFEMVASPNIADGNTTDISGFANGEITNENTTFVGTGALRESTSDSGSIALTTTEFTELEYSIQATFDSGFDTTYCFRVTNAGTPIEDYQIYPELTTRQKQDFLVQRGETVISGTTTTLVAGVDYTAPAATSSAFVRLTNNNYTGSGRNDVANTGVNANLVTAYVEDQSDITSSFTLSRPPVATDNTRVAWEIVEFIGQPGTDNEMVVRDVDEVYLPLGDFFATGSVPTTITDDADVAVFVTGHVNYGGSSALYNDGLTTADWVAGSNEPVFQRGDADTDIFVSYAVVEFTGNNWQVERVEHQYTAAGTPEVESISAIPSVTKGFIHAQKRVGEELNGLDEFGHQVFLSSLGAVTFQLRPGADTPSDHYSVAWVISNSQSGEGEMTVYQASGDEFSGSDLTSTSITFVSEPGVDTTNASIFATHDTNGGGTAYPRAIHSFYLASSTAFEIWRSEAGQPTDYRVEVVEWPIADTGIRQTNYRFYVNNDAIEPTDPWPVGAANLGENFSITGSDDPLGEAERVRIRMALQISNATLPADIVAFKLQYGLMDTSCSAITTWTDVGAAGSGVAWRGYDGTPVDGTEVATATPATGVLKLSTSDVAGTYEEENDSLLNPYTVNVGEEVEYDWLVEHNGAAQRSDYCFRMVESDGTTLDGYNNYPTVRTSGYTPVINNWRWYDDELNVTPTTPLASENTAPVDVANDDVVKLRTVVSEVESAEGTNVKFALQFSQYSDFSDGGTFVTSTTSCTASSTWCYADGGGDDNALIPSAVISVADTCSGGTGDGCGTHNETPDDVSTLTQPANSNMEFEFTLQQVNPRVNTVYYFRLYDTAAGDEVVASSSYPSVVTAGPTLVFSVGGVDAGQSIAGIVTDATTTAASIPFGSMQTDISYESAQELNVDTNATQGYQILVYATQPLTNTYGDTIPPISSSNGVPAGWSTACTGGATGCFGYHATDATLFGGSARFAPPDSYAALSTTAEEIAYSSLPGNNTHEIVYRLQFGVLQPAGQYETDIVYIAVPVY